MATLFVPRLTGDSAPAQPAPVTSSTYAVDNVSTCPACNQPMRLVKAAGHSAWLCEADRVVLPELAPDVQQ